MYVPLEDFRTAVAQLAELLASQKARILIPGMYPPVRFEFDPSAENLELLRAAGHATDSLLDITDVLVAALEGTARERFAEVRKTGERWTRDADDDESEAEVEAEAVALAKYDLVLDALPIADLRARRWAKATSTNLILDAVSWEVVAKLAASDGAGPAPDTPPTVAILRLSGADILEEIYSDDSATLTLTLDSEDIAYLVDVLQAAKSKLA